MTATTTADVPERPPFLPTAARLIVSGVNSLLHFISLLVVSPFSRSAAWAIYMHWGKMVCRIFGIRVSLRDDNNGDLGPKPHLYVWLNQTSLAEILTLQVMPPLYKVANVEYAAMPLAGWACVLLRDIVIVRQWKNQAKRGIERAAARLARGETWAISIEGARSPDGALLPCRLPYWLREAAFGSWTCSRNFATSLEPMSPVPPMPAATPSCSLGGAAASAIDSAQHERCRRLAAEFDRPRARR